MASKSNGQKQKQKAQTPALQKKVIKEHQDLFNSGLPGDNPFQTIYQRTFGGTEQKNRPNTSDARTPMRQHNDKEKQNKRQNSEVQFQPQLGSNRRFGQYLGSDFPTFVTGMSANPYQKLPIGYDGVRDTRCTDRFVRYPYPKLFSNYKQNYPSKLKQATVTSHKQAFNLEKESKIINPHRMDLGTTHGNAFTGRKGFPAEPVDRKVVEEPKPICAMSSYMASFPNWDNGKKDIFHERHPQYPVYSIPFAGESTYKKTHTESPMKELLKQEQRLQGRSGSQIKLGCYVPTKFEFTTTNSQNFKDFRFVNAHPPEAVKKCAPQVNPVQTKALPGHFRTMNASEFKKHQLRTPQVDLIPYP